MSGGRRCGSRPASRSRHGSRPGGPGAATPTCESGAAGAGQSPDARTSGVRGRPTASPIAGPRWGTCDRGRRAARPTPRLGPGRLRAAPGPGRGGQPGGGAPRPGAPSGGLARPSRDGHSHGCRLEHENGTARARTVPSAPPAMPPPTTTTSIRSATGASQEAALGGGPKKPVMRRRRPSSASSPKSMPSVTIVPSPARSAQVKRIAP